MPSTAQSNIRVTPTVLRPGRTPDAARALCAATAALLVLAILGRLLAADPRMAFVQLIRDDSFYLLIAVSHATLGVLIVRRLPGNPVGRILLVSAVAAATSTAVLTYPNVGFLRWASEWVPLIPIMLLPMPLLVFPSGGLQRWWWHIIWRAGISGVFLAAALLAVASWIDPVPIDEWSATRVVDPVADAMARTAFAVGVVVFVGTTAGGIVTMVKRRQGTDDHMRGQIRMLSYGLALVVPALAVEPFLAGAWLVAALSFPTSMTVAIVAHGMYDIDLFINRSVVYAILTVLVFSAYSVTVRLFELGFSAATGQASLVATGVVAAAFVPIRDRVERAVNHLLYGDRDDPYAVVSRLGHQLQPVLDPDAVLPGIVDTVMTALRLPYAEVRVWRDGRQTPAVARGRLAADPVTFPMRHHGALIGQLIVAPRAAGHRLTEAEETLLSDLAQRSAGAVAAALMVQEARTLLDRYGHGQMPSSHNNGEDRPLL